MPNSRAIPPAPAGFDEKRLHRECQAWYQRWQVFEGIYTPGVRSVEAMCRCMHLPDDLTGKRVLDVGAWNGCMSFECQRRGACEVIAIGPENPDETGFNLLRELTGSDRVTYQYGTCYQLDPAEMGDFDVVLFCGVLYHLRYPLLGLDNVRRVCRGELFVETHVSDPELAATGERLVGLPLWRFYRHDQLSRDASNWFGPTVQAVVEALESSGFGVSHAATLAPSRVVFRAAVKPGLPEFLSILSAEGVFYDSIARPLFGPWEQWDRPKPPPAPTAVITPRSAGGMTSLLDLLPAGQAPAVSDSAPARNACLLVSSGLLPGEGGSKPGDGAVARGQVRSAFLPLLEQWAPVREVANQETALEKAVQQARAAGLVPLHLAFTPFGSMKLAPGVPNIAFTCWEFAEVPGQTGFPSSANWLSTTKQLSMLVAQSEFTRRSFVDAGADVTVEALLPPVAGDCFDVPVWHGDQSVRWRGPCYALSAPRDASQDAPWTFPVVDRLNLDGIVYHAVVDTSDPCSNWQTLTEAYLEALSDRADATLVIQQAADERLEYRSLARVLQHYRTIAPTHACRLLVVPGSLSAEQRQTLITASTFYINGSRAVGACLPLQSALAAGRPAIAPCHTALEDYIDPSVALVVKSRPEPTYWPITWFSTAVWYDVNRPSLTAAFQESYRLAHDDPKGYQRLAHSARQRMADLCSEAVVAPKLYCALNLCLSSRKA